MDSLPRIIKVGKDEYPHKCSDAIRLLFNYPKIAKLGTIAECSCSKKYILKLESAWNTVKPSSFADFGNTDGCWVRYRG